MYRNGTNMKRMVVEHPHPSLRHAQAGELLATRHCGSGWPPSRRGFARLASRSDITTKYRSGG